ncbi:MAG: hypothetical protein L7S56_03945 [Candidatus Poseidonia sp.]|nr:hypothetical protein [Poseidonia sp.]
MSAESHYLNALEALDEGDRELAQSEALLATQLDPEHTDAWVLLSDACMNGKEPRSMLEAAKALTGAKKAVLLEPERLDMWVRGGRLLADELGLLHDALQWWQDCRHHAPHEVTPLVEMASILADMGEYEESRKRLEAILNDNMDVATSQFARIQGLLNLVKAAATQDAKDIFKPYQKHHNGWEAIRSKMKKPPVSESFIFMLLAVPILFFVIFFSSNFSGEGWGAFCLTTSVIMFIVLFAMRLAKRWFQIINRPAFNLLRAMNFEVSTGFTVIPEDVRTSVLHVYIMQRKPLAWQERMLKIMERKNSLPRNYSFRLPDFDSHLVDEEDEDDEAWAPLTAYEEE